MKYLAILFMLFSLPAQAETVKATWYGKQFHGRKTANGERFDQYSFTAAHRYFKFGTVLHLTHKDKHVIVRINDRGPFKRGISIDMSYAAAKKLGCIDIGICKVKMTILSKGN